MLVIPIFDFENCDFAGFRMGEILLFILYSWNSKIKKIKEAVLVSYFFQGSPQINRGT